MDTKKYLIAVIVVFVAYSAVGYAIHNVLLRSVYQGLQDQSVRSFAEFTRRLPLLYLANLIFSLVFCLIYTRGYEVGKSWFGQGLRYGLIMGSLLAPLALIGYVALPVPGTLVLQWVLYNYVHLLICGLVVASIYQIPPPPLPA